MSYLSPLRLHFAGRFLANVPTANNYVPFINPALSEPPKRSWNPNGDCTWRLLRCAVTTAIIDDRELPPASDSVLSCLVADSDRQAPAKITDLDALLPHSTSIYGLELRICSPDGVNLLRGRCATVTWQDPFIFRTPISGNDGVTGAAFQTVITELDWSPDLSSPFLLRLKEVSTSGRLSLKFNVDGYDADQKSDNFTTGRIVGTIGPADAAEPSHFILGRHLLSAGSGRINHAAAVVDTHAGKIRVDLGNSLATEKLAGPFKHYGRLTLRCRTAAGSKERREIGEFPDPSRPRWYETTAGIVAFPLTHLTAGELMAIRESPLELWQEHPEEQDPIALSEPDDGYYTRADVVVFRIAPEKEKPVTVDATLYATRFGSPCAVNLVAERFEAGIAAFEELDFRGGLPREALAIRPTATDETGKGTAHLTATDPKHPRSFLDGQVYCIRYRVEGAQEDRQAFWDVVQVRVWDLPATTEPTWEESVLPVFKYYARLFPVMANFLDLTAQSDVETHRDMLLHALQLPIENPNHMPATRDLSPAKCDRIVQWLKSLPTSSGHVIKKTNPRPVENFPGKNLSLPQEVGPGKADALRAILARSQKPKTDEI